MVAHCVLLRLAKGLKAPETMPGESALMPRVDAVVLEMLRPQRGGEARTVSKHLEAEAYPDKRVVVANCND